MTTENNNIYKRDFIYTCPSKVLTDLSLTLNELKIYMLIRSFRDSMGSAFPNNEWIAKEIGCDSSTVIRTIDKLVQKSYL